MTNFYQKHIFFCTNQKANGRKCCATDQADDCFDYAKQQLRARDLSGEGKVRISKSGCLGRCQAGPCIVIYPEGIWYSYQNRADLDAIIEQHCEKNQVVEHLLIDSQ